MPIEVDYQTDIVRGMRSQGGFAEKLANKFKKGIPDLLLKLPEWRYPLFLEAKLVKVMPLKHYRIETTALQRLCLKSMRDAGMHAGILLIVPKTRGAADLVISWDIDATTMLLEYASHRTYRRSTGEDWGEAIRALLSDNVPTDDFILEGK